MHRYRLGTWVVAMHTDMEQRHEPDYILSFKTETIPQGDVEGIVAAIVHQDAAIPAAVRKAHVRNLRCRHTR